MSEEQQNLTGYGQAQISSEFGGDNQGQGQGQRGGRGRGQRGRGGRGGQGRGGQG